MNKFELTYDQNKYEEIIPEPKNTLQLFITNKCNLHCNGCFYQDRLGKDEINLGSYWYYVLKYKNQINKVILLGGEPTLHPDLELMISFNTSLGLQTTVYTNGSKLNKLKQYKNEYDNNFEIRLGIYGCVSSEKPLYNIEEDLRTPVTIVYMLRQDNIDELYDAVYMAEKHFNCQKFFISSIRDTHSTGDYWLNTKETIPLDQYFLIVQKFILDYNGNIPEIHIARRGVINTRLNQTNISKCRFGNIFPNGEKVICPFDISKNIISDELNFGERDCDKNGCLLQKIVLKKRGK